MRKSTAAVAAAILFVGGIGVGYTAKPGLSPAMYHDRPNAEAAKTLTEVALVQAEDGSWERIGVGRVHYLGGQRAEGQRIFDSVLAGKHEASDVYRIARVYREAGEWDRAKPLFDRYLAENPEEATGLAEVGAYYLLDGDRDTAERLFDRAFAAESDNPWVTLHVAGAYLGLAPQQ